MLATADTVIDFSIVFTRLSANHGRSEAARRAKKPSARAKTQVTAKGDHFHSPPEAGAQVRILPGAPAKRPLTSNGEGSLTSDSDISEADASHVAPAKAHP